MANTVCFKNPTLQITIIGEDCGFRNAFDYTHSTCSNYLLYTVTANNHNMC